MKNIAQFIFMHGAAVAVTIILLIDLVRGLKSAVAARWAKVFKWLVVVALSLWQVACWHAEASFDRAFSATPGGWDYKPGFIILLLVWMLHQVVIHLLKWRRQNR
ncbi:MAG: hypothetical protein QNJ40_00340 [Xanthomonadales bacterium]|nr:hypothetical protein [Xanthomonadales bacterium]